MSGRKPAWRTLVGILVAAGLLVGGLGCGDGDKGSEALGDVESTLLIVLSGGAGIQGLQLTITYDVRLVLVRIDEAGPLALGTCEDNAAVANGVGRSICADVPAFDPPAVPWEVTFRHSPNLPVREGILGVVCQASDDEGTVIPVTCQTS